MAFRLTLMLSLGIPLVLCAWWLARRGRYWAVTPLCGLVFWIGFATFSLPMLAQSLFTFVLAMVWLAIRPRPGVVLVGALVAMIVPLSLWLSGAVPRAAMMERLLDEHPVVSVAPRLDYELKREPDLPALDPLPPKVRRQWIQMEDAMGPTPWGSIGKRYLRELHDDTYYYFVTSAGFGSGRMPGVLESAEGNLRHRHRAGAIPQPVIEDLPRDHSTDAPEPDSNDALSSFVSTEAFYRRSVIHFLDFSRFGYVESANYTIDFEAHRFTREFDTKQPLGDPPYRLARLELVSLLKHQQPVVYVSENLPNMDELRDVPTRPVTAFEGAALARLRRVEDLVTEDAGNQLKMLGAIRASETCLKCHRVRRGELLGAFRYELVPVDGGARGNGEPAF